MIDVFAHRLIRQDLANGLAKNHFPLTKVKPKPKLLKYRKRRHIGHFDFFFFFCIHINIDKI